MTAELVERDSEWFTEVVVHEDLGIQLQIGSAGWVRFKDVEPEDWVPAGYIYGLEFWENEGVKVLLNLGEEPLEETKDFFAATTDRILNFKFSPPLVDSLVTEMVIEL